VCSERRDDGPSGFKESGKATNFLEPRHDEVRLALSNRIGTQAREKPGRLGGGERGKPGSTPKL
jgi:hypothetical protein